MTITFLADEHKQFFTTTDNKENFTLDREKEKDEKKGKELAEKIIGQILNDINKQSK